MVRSRLLLGVATLTSVLSWTVIVAQETGSTTARNASAAAEWRARGVQSGYNLDRAEAIAAFRHAIDADPTSPASHRLLAATAWTALLFDQGAITIEDYLGTAQDVPHAAPDPIWNALFRSSIDRASALADALVRAHPDSVDAQYQLGATNALQAAYSATVEGRVVGSLGFIRHAYRAHDRLLQAAPERKDAGLVVGIYRYTISTLSFPKRVGAYLAGLSGSRNEGLRLVEAAASYRSDAQPQAKFTLILLYTREKRYDDALRVVRELKEQFPRNRLIWLEEGSTLLRAGRADAARQSLETGLSLFLEDTRPRARGEESRWRYAYGSALNVLDDGVAAHRELTTALGLATRDWVRGRIHIELGQLAGKSGDCATALAAYRDAERLCSGDHDDACADQARERMKERRP